MTSIDFIEIRDRLADEGHAALQALDYASWVARHHAQDWQMGITQRYYVHLLADRAWRWSDRLSRAVDRVSKGSYDLSCAAYDRWVLSGRAWERHLDATIGRAESDRFFLGPEGPQTMDEMRAAEAAR